MSARSTQSGISQVNLGSEYTDEVRELLVAVERWRTRHHGAHPTCRDVLQIVKALGYHKVVDSLSPGGGVDEV